jgi:hypothetical protein
VVGTGRTHLSENKASARADVKVALQDAAGNTVGTIAVVFPLRPAVTRPDTRRGANASATSCARASPRPGAFGAYPASASAPQAMQSEYDKAELATPRLCP